MALATITDLENRGVCIDDEARAVMMLDDVSAIVEGYTGQRFEQGEHTVTVWPTNGSFTLYGKDITDVAAVDEHGDDVPLRRVGVYRWYAGTDRQLTVTYTAGWTEVPDDVVAVVCSVAARALSIKPGQMGHSQDTAGPFSFTIGSAAAQGAAGLLPAELQVLNRYRRVGHAIHAASWAGAAV